MLDQELCKHILTIGTDYSNSYGGVAQVLCSYSKIYKPFRFLATTTDGSAIYKLAFCLISWLRFCLLCLRRDIQVIHIHGSSYNSFWRKRLYIYTSKIFRKKVVYHIHGGGFDTFSLQNRKTVYNTLHKVDELVVLSESWKSFFEQMFNVTKLRVICNITDAPVLSGKKSMKTEAVFLGSINKNKGIYDLLDVIRLHKEYLQNQFILHIGGIGEIDKVKAMIEDAGIDDIVKYDGWIDKNKKTELLSKANIFILPSYVEGLPISILEAMSYKMAVISTPVGGIPEVVKNGVNGYLVPPGDLDELFNVIADLIKDKAKCTKMGEESYKIVQPHLPQNVENQLLSLYNDLIGNIR